MKPKHQDTRSREEILGQARFAPYLAAPRLDEIGLRELRTFDAFLLWTEQKAVKAPVCSDFLAFCVDDRSCRRLENLRTAFDRLLPSGAPEQQAVRDAIRTKRPRSRSCDWRSRDELLAQEHFRDYRALPGMQQVALEDLRVLDRFLVFARARRIEIPTVQDFLAFAADRKSSRRLRSLKYALETLLPGNPGVLLTLQDAIRAKGPAKRPASARAPRKARYSVPATALPRRWQEILAAMQNGEDTNDLPPPAESRIRSMAAVLREYARVMIDAGLPVEITIEGARLMEEERSRRAKDVKDSAYLMQGNRPATQWTAVQRLRMFAQHLGLDGALIDALRTHENVLRRQLGDMVPLKFGRLNRMPDLKETWQIALNLLDDSSHVSRQATALRLVNEATILALWTLLPLRLGDGQLCWGAEVGWDRSQYRVDIDTEKADVPLQGKLHPWLTPFLDALLLGGVDQAYLGLMRERAQSGNLPLFRDTTGRMLSTGYPSRVWRTHMGTGAHIARTRVHTELGRLGPEGVEAALALCAQRDPATAADYQAQAVARAKIDRGQAMIESLLDELDPPSTA